eukprot:GEZU01027207.1.p1 GENE.GEZU01027207.1~~GEZU01027207.1.p1  ORF type:complete len:116 (-),score=16.04 GEZU01027207.1:63-371(-)
MFAGLFGYNNNNKTDQSSNDSIESKLKAVAEAPLTPTGSADKIGPIFGARLKPNAEVPEFIVKAFKYLEENALQEEGIFRVPGNNTEIKEYKKRIDAGMVDR